MKLRTEEKVAYLMLTPATLWLLFVVGYPVILAVLLSLTDSVVGRPGNFIGLGNFVALSQTKVFITTLTNSFLFVAVTVALKTALGTSLALLLNQRLVGQKIWRAAILLPWVVPTALSTLGWKWMFDPTYSVLNWLLAGLGLCESGIGWLSHPVLARLSIIVVNTWRGIPFFAINILAGLKTVPKELYEAAEVDGAGVFARFWHITIPSIRPVLATVVLFSTVMTISDFDIVYVLTRGGPMDSTHLLATLAYQTGLASGFLGKGAAISLFLFPVLVIVVYFQLRIIRRRWAW